MPLLRPESSGSAETRFSKVLSFGFTTIEAFDPKRSFNIETPSSVGSTRSAQMLDFRAVSNELFVLLAPESKSPINLMPLFIEFIRLVFKLVVRSGMARPAGSMVWPDFPSDFPSLFMSSTLASLSASESFWNEFLLSKSSRRAVSIVSGRCTSCVKVLLLSVDGADTNALFSNVCIPLVSVTTDLTFRLGDKFLGLGFLLKFNCILSCFLVFFRYLGILDCLCEALSIFVSCTCWEADWPTCVDCLIGNGSDRRPSLFVIVPATACVIFVARFAARIPLLWVLLLVTAE